MSFDCIERPRVNAHPVTGERSVRRERSDVTSDFVGEDGVVAGLRAEGLPDRGPLNDGTLDISHTKPWASFLRTRGASDVEDYLRDHSAPLHVTTCRSLEVASNKSSRDELFLREDDAILADVRERVASLHRVLRVNV